MIRAWVLVLVINGTVVDQGPKQTSMQCEADRKAFIQSNPTLKYQIRCEWRNPY